MNTIRAGPHDFTLISEACHDSLFGTGFESRPVRISVIGVVHIQCSELLKNQYPVCRAVYVTVHNKEPLKSLSFE